MSEVNENLYRLFTKDGSKHCTGVVLKTGEILEVKNEVTGIKGSKFESLEAWRAARADDFVVKTDAPPIRDTKGFNVPKDPVNAYRWLQWCYSIICELAPHLLENETLQAAYNALAEVSTLYSHDLHTYNVYKSDIERYNPKNIKTSLTQYGDTISIGYPFRFKSHYNYTVPLDSMFNGNFIPEVHREPTKKIIDSYKAICEILGPVIGAQLEKKYQIADLKRFIISTEKAIKAEGKKRENFLKKSDLQLDCLNRGLKGLLERLEAATKDVPQ